MLESFFETSINIASGFAISWLVWMYLVPVFWPEYASPATTAFWITMLFTVTSFARSLIWRRFFAHGIHRWLHQKFKDYNYERTRS